MRCRSSDLSSPLSWVSFLNLEQAELLRIQRYGEAKRFYLGKQWNFKREDGEPLVTINYYRKLIDKCVEFLLSKGFVNRVPDALVEVTLPFLDEVWKYNRKDQLSWELGLEGAITGDAFVLITYEEPTPMQKRVNPYSQGRIRVTLLGSEQVYPTWDPLNIDTLTAVRIETIFYADRGVQRTDRDDRKDHQGRTLYTKRFTQIITPDQIVEQFHGDQPIVKPNILGEIPLVHIRNIPMPKEYYGLPDGQDLVDLQRELNEKSTDISDVIHYQGMPVTVIFGAKAKNLERGARQIWGGLPADARVEQLQLNTDLGAAREYKNEIKKAMHELSDVPEGALGQMQPISNTSGVALSMTWQPLKGKIDKKRPYYSAGLEQINYFILRIAQTMGLINLPFDLCKCCGGRIVETVTDQKAPVWTVDPTIPQGGKYVMVNVRKKRCFAIDRQTLDFLDPQEQRLKFVREYGFGTEVREAPFWMIEREMRSGKPSFWDYAADDLKAEQDHRQATADHQEEAGKVQPQQTDENGQSVPQAPPPPTPPVRKVTKLPPGFVDVPPEPENVVVRHTMLHPTTGEVIQELEQEMFLVPTDCQTPSYLNPFESKVEFNDVLPKDESLQAQLYMVYQQNGWVDDEWVRERIPEIAETKKELEKRLKAKGQAAPQNPAGGYQENAPPAETGEGGDQTPIQGQSEIQQQGAEQNQE